MPPASLEPSNIHLAWQLPTGLAAYDFGFGTVFFDYDNDSDQDLYWLGSIIDRGMLARERDACSGATAAALSKTSPWSLH